MGDVLNLPTPKEAIWCCNECGCVSWLVHEDFLECTHCYNRSTFDGTWKLPPPLTPITEQAGRNFSEMGVTNSSFLIKSHTKNITEDDLSIILKPTGLIHTYNGVTPNKTSLSWVKRQLKQALKLLDCRLP